MESYCFSEDMAVISSETLLRAERSMLVRGEVKQLLKTSDLSNNNED